jgi:hypothetical protein
LDALVAKNNVFAMDQVLARYQGLNYTSKALQEYMESTIGKEKLDA